MRNKKATRRGFFVGAGAVVTAPAAFAGAPPSRESTALAARLASLEDEQALRRIAAELFAALSSGEHAKLEQANAAPREIRAANLDSYERFDVSDDRSTARALIECDAVFAAPIDAPGSTLLDMARAQGEGFVRAARRAALELHCEREASGWRLVRARLIDDG